MELPARGRRARARAGLRRGPDLRAVALGNRVRRLRAPAVGSGRRMGAGGAPVRLPVSRGVATGGLPSSAARSALRAACGDGGAGPSLAGGEVGARPRRVLGGGRGGQSLAGGVALGFVDVAVLPEAPDDAAPGAAEDADGVLVAAAARSGAVIDVCRPRVVVAAGVGERADRRPEAVVAGPAEARAFGFARFDGDGGLAAVV